QEVDTLQATNAAVNASLKDMTAIRDELATEVETLVSEYDELSAQHTELSGQLASYQDQLSKAQSALSRAKRNAANELSELRTQIEELQGAKAELLAAMDVLAAQNDSLRQRTGELETNLAQSQEANTQLQELNTTKEGEIRQLTYQVFKASSFEVAPEVQRGKPTSKAGRTRRIKASFDLNNVPAAYQGERPIYLVITDATGTPIPRTDYITTKVQAPDGKSQDIMAVEAKQAELTEAQRLTFSHELESKLDAGTYTLAAYTDIGLLGSSTFRLR
ncbi:MAG: hypothetical protein D6772_03435, partial [Bacteroidetes bacterium]